MTLRTARPSVLSGERGIVLFKKIRQSLSAQLFCGVLVSALAAAAVFGAFYGLGNLILSRTVYGKPFLDRLSQQRFGSLQEYVTAEGITANSIHQVNVWSGRDDRIYLTIYQGDKLIYESPFAGLDTVDAESYNPAFENPDKEHALVLADGMPTRAYLYYFDGEVLYFWIAALSGAAAFLVFSVCFVTLVNRKLRYIKQLKGELDILAGGDLNYPVQVSYEDELGELASGIDHMRRSILAHQKAEEEIRAANSQLVTAVSHDLRTPLTSLLAYLEMLNRGKYDSPEQMGHFVKKSLEQTLRIKSMADQLFEYFLVYSSEWEQPELETVDADALLQQFWGEYAFSLESRGFRVERDFQELRGSFQVNTELLSRALDNLYSNLLKYADPGEPITIRFFREGQQGVLLLTNAIRKGKPRESTSIGLGTCQRILHYHEGSFQVTRDADWFSAKLTLPLGD